MTNQTFYMPGFMDLSSYRLESVCGGETWDSVVLSSRQGSVFSLTDYLDNIDGCHPSRWFCFKGNDLKAGLIVMESDDGRDCILVDDVIHSGILFMPNSDNQNKSQVMAENFRVTSFISQQLIDKYRNISLSTHPDLDDLRPFIWHNYGVDGPKFVVDVRYTSFLNLEGFHTNTDLNQNPIYMACSKSRRQEIRYAVMANVTTTTSNDVDEFISLYKHTLERQSQNISEYTCHRLHKLVCAILSKGLATMYVSRASNGLIGSMAVFGIFNDRAYYLFGANNPDLRSEHTGTMVIWDAICDLYCRGIKLVDLEGINSPLRGQFKLSFGGDIIPYYHLSMSQD